MKARFEQLSAKFAKAYQNVDREVAQAEINEAITAIRKQARKQRFWATTAALRPPKS